MQSDQYSDKEEVAYVANFPGADIEDDVIVVRIDGGELEIPDDDDRILGDVEIAGVKEAIETTLNEALSSVGNDSVVVSTDDPLDVSGETVEVEQSSPVKIVPLETLPTVLENTSGDEIDPATQQTLSSIASALESNGGDKLLVDHPSVLDVSSRDGRNLGDVDVTDTPTSYPNSGTQGHDLTGGDLTIGPLDLSETEAIMVSATSTDGNSFSASIEWTDGNGNTYISEAAADIEMASITSDWVRLVRKGSHATVTLTDESGAASNLVNAFVDAHR